MKPNLALLEQGFILLIPEYYIICQVEYYYSAHSIVFSQGTFYIRAELSSPLTKGLNIPWAIRKS